MCFLIYMLLDSLKTLKEGRKETMCVDDRLVINKVPITAQALIK